MDASASVFLLVPFVAKARLPLFLAFQIASFYLCCARSGWPVRYKKVPKYSMHRTVLIEDLDCGLRDYVLDSPTHMVT
jgi:hypothetical protein